MRVIIETQGLSKTYRMGAVQVAALCEVDLQVREGEFVALMGPSGSGKSTLMHLLGCLDTPTSGKYFLQERDVSKLSKDERARTRNARIGFVFQTFNLLPRLDALGNVALPLMYSNTPQVQERASKALERVSLAHRAGHQPNEMSGGERQRVAIARAQETVTRLENTSRDLLDLSRLESHASQAAQTNVNLLALVQANAEVYASRAEQAGVRFEMRLPREPIYIKADAGQVERAIHNVIDNALKFTPSGGTVQVELEQEPNATRLSISDTGIGIPREDLPSLFQRFHRARNAAAYPGSGLGLAIVQAILREQHGNVRVEPLEVGTRFILEWRSV